jgi:hypothetical protein
MVRRTSGRSMRILYERDALSGEKRRIFKRDKEW